MFDRCNDYREKTHSGRPGVQGWIACRMYWPMGTSAGFPDLQVRTIQLDMRNSLGRKHWEWHMARFWLFIANSIGILILIVLLAWIGGWIR